MPMASGTLVFAIAWMLPASTTATVAPPVPATPNFADATQPSKEPLVVTPVSNPASPPPKKSYQIALFVNADATSQRIQEWFTQNKQLAALKESCEFQVYTATNAIYKTRYPPEPRPDWWPPYLVWPPVPEPPIEILYPPPIYTWPRLPPNHPYHLPPGFSYPNNLPPGHPGRNVPPPRPPRRKLNPQDIVDSDVGSDGDSSAMI